MGKLPVGPLFSASREARTKGPGDGATRLATGQICPGFHQIYNLGSKLLGPESQATHSLSTLCPSCSWVRQGAGTVHCQLTCTVRMHALCRLPMLSTRTHVPVLGSRTRFAVVNLPEACVGHRQPSRHYFRVGTGLSAHCLDPLGMPCYDVGFGTEAKIEISWCPTCPSSNEPAAADPGTESRSSSSCWAETVLVAAGRLRNARLGAASVPGGQDLGRASGGRTR